MAGPFFMDASAIGVLRQAICINPSGDCMPRLTMPHEKLKPSYALRMETV
jgi:hypothetical protein